ncbi:MAG: hypothetical protein OXE94_07255 [Aestuariivita sp.]|nr:hypothetical protein [Aestuariivita sp.]MCY4202066.1 hypothetical protein [Aestuariivita sp.]
MTASLAEQKSSFQLGQATLTIPIAAGNYSLRRTSDSTWSPTAFAPENHSNAADGSLCPKVAGTAVRMLNLENAYVQQGSKPRDNFLDTVNAYNHRISVLEEQAADEGIFLNSRSRETFQVFFRSNPMIKLGELYLLENGNLRAIWKGDGASHVGLQFLENGLIQFVLFKQRHPDVPVSRRYGRDTPSGVLAQIFELKLDKVLYR